MIKYVTALAMVAALSACSSGGSDTTGSGTTGGTTGGGTTDGGSGTSGGPITPSGNLPGAWYGSNNFGDGVMIIDADSNVYSLAANGSGQYETVFGPASQQLQRYSHRDSDNPAFADSFTIAGDPADPVTYNLSVLNDGQQISNASPAGNFTMTFATENDLPAISLADIAGDWTAKTSFAPTGANLVLKLTVDAGGTVFGSTQYNDGGVDVIQGSAAAAAGATQYLTVSFQWTNKTRSGVLYRDRLDNNRLVLNAVGPGDEQNPVPASFTARMIRE